MQGFAAKARRVAQSRLGGPEDVFVLLALHDKQCKSFQGYGHHWMRRSSCKQRRQASNCPGLPGRLLVSGVLGDVQEHVGGLELLLGIISGQGQHQPGNICLV